MENRKKLINACIATRAAGKHNNACNVKTKQLEELLRLVNAVGPSVSKVKQLEERLVSFEDAYESADERFEDDTALTKKTHALAMQHVEKKLAHADNEILKLKKEEDIVKKRFTLAGVHPQKV